MKRLLRNEKDNTLSKKFKTFKTIFLFLLHKRLKIKPKLMSCFLNNVPFKEKIDLNKLLNTENSLYLRAMSLFISK